MFTPTVPVVAVKEKHPTWFKGKHTVRKSRVPVFIVDVDKEGARSSPCGGRRWFHHRSYKYHHRCTTFECDQVFRCPLPTVPPYVFFIYYI